MGAMSRDLFLPAFAGLLGAALLLISGTFLLPERAHAQSLRGSPAALDIQNRMARAHEYTYIDTPERVRYFVEQGWLVRVRPNRDFALHAVSFPYARQEVAVFIQRLAAQYRAACGEQLVVTSLTRPSTRQPRNASDRSVHPTGMAMDLRYSRDRNCRAWLEDVLLSLEGAGILDATLERYPRHYHIALFPRQYMAYLDQVETRRATALSERMAAYTIQRGDSLWEIARQHGTTVDEIQALNGLNGNRIYAGQVIDLPTGG